MNADLQDTGVVLRCAICGQRNRVPFKGVGEVTRCGKCKLCLPPVNHPLDIPNGATFASIVQSASIPVIVDFWAPWCGPCRMTMPEFAKAAASLAGESLLLKVNTETCEKVAIAHHITAIPTMVMFVHGMEVTRVSGGMSALRIIAFAREAAHQTA